MTDLQTRAEDYSRRFYELLPQVYRARDSEGQLQLFLRLFAFELARLRGNVDQLWRDFYVDSCQDWVIPYIGDLVGTQILFNDAARNRIDVKNTVKWRRQKGTLRGLEDVAAETSDWGLLARECFQYLIWSQQLNHRRLHALQTIELDDASKLSRVTTPFDLSMRTVDLRPAHPQQIANLAFYYWGIASHPGGRRTPAHAGAERYRFDALNRDRQLYAGGDKPDIDTLPDIKTGRRPDSATGNADDTPIRGRDFADNSTYYFGQPHGLSIYVDGILLCETIDTRPTQSITPCLTHYELAANRGLIICDQSLYGGGAKPFQIAALRLAAQTQLVDGVPTALTPSPTSVFANNYTLAAPQGELASDTFTYTKGAAFNGGTPDHHQPVLLLGISRLAADDAFPESEIIVRNSHGESLLVFLPDFAGLPAGQTLYLYVADDGSTYYARASHDAGDIDLNPEPGRFGAYLPRHLARAAAGQVLPVAAVRPVRHRTPVYRSLCCWDRPLQKPPLSGEVAIDPERGRFVFPATEIPAGELSVEYRYALSGELGAGLYFRGDLNIPAGASGRLATVAKTRDAAFTTIQAAIDWLPEGNAEEVVVLILDSATYTENLTINNLQFPGGLRIVAGTLQQPVIQCAAGDALVINAATVISSFGCDGLSFSGGDLQLAGDIASCAFRYCTLNPDSVNVNFFPVNAGAEISLQYCISGPLHCSANVALMAVNDAIVQHPDAKPESTGGHVALVSPNKISLDRVTVFGELQAALIDVSNCILTGAYHISDPESCLRYSRVAPGSSGTAKMFRNTKAFPVFVAYSFGAAGYMHLHPNTSASVRQSAEDGGEMGAFYRAGHAWREQNLQIRLDEYMPAGLRPVLVPALP